MANSSIAMNVTEAKIELTGTAHDQQARKTAEDIAKTNAGGPALSIDGNSSERQKIGHIRGRTWSISAPGRGSRSSRLAGQVSRAGTPITSLLLILSPCGQQRLEELGDDKSIEGKNTD